MNTNQATIEKLDAMRLRGMSRSFRATIEGGVRHQFSADEMVAHLTDSEWDERHNRRVQRLLKGSRFRYSACVEEIDFGLNRNLDRNQVARLSDCGWIEQYQAIICTGPTSSGKSFLASAFTRPSVMKQSPTRSVTASPMARIASSSKESRCERSTGAETSSARRAPNEY